MKFLISLPHGKAAGGPTETVWTTRREPVVPCFPSQHAKAFLTIPSFRLAGKAEVADTDADADTLADALAKEYPGLPRTLHENYILGVWKAVYDIPAGTVFSVAVSQKQATLINDKTGATIILWNEQPLK